MAAAPHTVAVLALDGAYPFDLGIPSRILGAADGRYEVLTCTADGQPVMTSAGFQVLPGHGPEILPRADTVVVAAFEPSRAAPTLTPPVAAALAQVRPGARIMSICTGAFTLAATGILDGRPATTHWMMADSFRRWFPRVRLDPGVLFVDDGDVLTSAGAASGIDLCLHVLRRDYGGEVANQVARRCVVPAWRDGGQAQYIEQPVPRTADLSTSPARQWALDNLHLPLTLADLAGQARMSNRTFTRRFRAETGTSPGQWLIGQRVARARELLESTDLTVDQVASRVGFATAASLRQHLHASIGVAPLAYRRTFHPAGR
jgi:transcriptional regulator GlxA family with amidase domain